jgi:hypothetical protein
MADFPPKKNAAFTVTFPIYDADGDLVTAAASLDSEVSKDGGTFADCTNEATEIATSSGVYSLALTSTEMNADIVATITKTGTAGAKTAVNVMYTVTRQLVDLAFPTTSGRSLDVTATGAAGVDFDNIEGTLDAAEIGADAITAAKIANGAIDAATFAAGAIDAAAIANGAIDAATFAAGAIDAAAIATGAIDADAIATDAVTELRSLVSGTSDSGSTTTMVDAARTEADTDYWKGCWILFTSGNISGQVRLITAFTPGTDTITFAPATTQAVATQTYEILPAGRVDLQQWLGSTVNALISGRVDVSVGAMQTAVIAAASFVAGAIDAAAIADNAIDANAIATGAITAAKFAAGAIDAAAIANGAIDAATFAANALDAAALATDAVNEIADGIMTRASSNWEGSAPVKSLGTAVMKAVHRIRDNAGTLEVYRSNGTTLHASQTVTTDAALEPIDELTGAA